MKSSSEETRSVTTPRWDIGGGRIVLQMSDSISKNVSATQIVRAEYKQSLEFEGMTVSKRPSEDLPTIHFSRFPLNARLALSYAGSDSSRMPVCWIELTGQNTSIILPKMPILLDQILTGEKWFPLVPEQFVEFQELLSGYGIQDLGGLSLRHYLDLLNQNHVPIYVYSDKPDEIEVPARESIPLSPDENGVDATLYPYQESGIRWLLSVTGENLGCILGDEMGLGKTLQIIALLAHENIQERTPNLVICPATIMENWRRELVRFAPQLTVELHCGSERTGFPSKLRQNHVIIVSYDTAVRDLSMLKMVLWNLVVIDEAQAIKNPETQRSSSLKQIPRRVGIAVTGTPVENSLRDLWSIMDFACPGFLGTQHKFESRFQDNTDDATRLEPLVSPLILRRLVSDVAHDLPEKIEIPQVVMMSDTNARAYEELRRKIIRKYGPAGGFVSLIKLRMFCAHPFLITKQTGDPSLFSTKYCRLIEILDEIILAGHKAIIFNAFKVMADILTRDLHGRYQIFTESIDGRTSISERQNIIDRFHDYRGAGVLVLNPRAAGTGLNITAARHVIHYTLEWNPAVEDQATARAYRRGQQYPVTVHRLYHPGTVEEIIDNRLQRKRTLAASAVIGTAGEESDVIDITHALEISPFPEGGQIL